MFIYVTENPFIRLNPLPAQNDYAFSLLESEGATDLFDMCNTNPSG